MDDNFAYSEEFSSSVIVLSLRNLREDILYILEKPEITEEGRELLNYVKNCCEMLISEYLAETMDHDSPISKPIWSSTIT